MMASVRRCATIPYEYTNSHLRRQIVMFVYNLVEYPILHVHIKGNYGHARLSKTQYKKKLKVGMLTHEEKRDYPEPGPFSLVGNIFGGFLGQRILW